MSLLVDQRNCKHEFSGRYRRCKHCDLPQEQYDLYVELQALNLRKPPPPAPAPRPRAAAVPAPPAVVPPDPTLPPGGTGHACTPQFGDRQVQWKTVSNATQETIKKYSWVYIVKQSANGLEVMDRHGLWTGQLDKAHAYPPTYAKHLAKESAGAYTTEQHPFEQQRSRI